MSALTEQEKVAWQILGFVGHRKGLDKEKSVKYIVKKLADSYAEGYEDGLLDD